MKTCSCCGRMLELDEYPMDRGKRYAMCLSCKAFYVKRRYDRARAARRITKVTPDDSCPA